VVKLYSYQEIPSEKLKQRLLEDAITRWVFKGAEDPKLTAWQELNKIKPKKMKKWRFLRYIFLKSIDKKRIENNLKPIHNL